MRGRSRHWHFIRKSSTVLARFVYSLSPASAAHAQDTLSVLRMIVRSFQPCVDRHLGDRVRHCPSWSFWSSRRSWGHGASSIRPSWHWCAHRRLGSSSVPELCGTVRFVCVQFPRRYCACPRSLRMTVRTVRICTDRHLESWCCC